MAPTLTITADALIRRDVTIAILPVDTSLQVVAFVRRQ